MAENERVLRMAFADIHVLYVKKVERKDHTREEVDLLLRWLTGYDQAGLEAAVADRRTLAQFFDQAPELTEKVSEITGVVCGIRVENIEDPLMQKTRYMDKLVDELARGKKLTSILRGDDPGEVA